MGACASKPNVLNGEAPEVASENVSANDVPVAAEEEVKKEEVVIAHDDANEIPHLSNLLKNEEGKGSAEEREDTSVPSEAKKELEFVEKDVDDAATADATCVDEKKIEEVKSETPVEQNVEEVVKPLLESIPSNKADEEKAAAAEEAPAETTVEEVKPETETTPADVKPAIQEEKIEEKSAPVDPKPETSSVEIKKTQEKPATKRGKFWWDK